MAQHFTSARTSINKTKLPRIYSIWTPVDSSAIRVLDYGCGKYIDHIKAALPPQVTYLPYDPYNQPDEVNQATQRSIATVKADTTICSNVLNVIDDDETLYQVARDLLRSVKRWHDVRVTVYEGDRSGVGRQTGYDQYQRNEPLRSYMKYFKHWGGKCFIKGGVLYAFTDKEDI